MKRILGSKWWLTGAFFCGATLATRGGELSLDPAEAQNPPAAAHSESSFTPRAENIWRDGVGSGFMSGLHELRLSAGPTLGLAGLFGHNNHNLALAMLDYGWVFSRVVGEGHWYRGNWELLGEAVAGGQYHPKAAYVAGAALMLRYNFTTGTPLVPFIDAGTGPSMQNIGLPDVSTTFEFDTQGGIGAHYFVAKNSAITLEARFFHLSNAGLHEPNQSVNTLAILTGWSWFF